MTTFKFEQSVKFSETNREEGKNFNKEFFLMFPSLAPWLKKQIGLTTGVNEGNISFVTPTGFKTSEKGFQTFFLEILIKEETAISINFVASFIDAYNTKHQLNKPMDYVRERQQWFSPLVLIKDEKQEVKSTPIQPVVEKEKPKVTLSEKIKKVLAPVKNKTKPKPQPDLFNKETPTTKDFKDRYRNEIEKLQDKNSEILELLGLPRSEALRKAGLNPLNGIRFFNKNYSGNVSLETVNAAHECLVKLLDEITNPSSQTKKEEPKVPKTTETKIEESKLEKIKSFEDLVKLEGTENYKLHPSGVKIPVFEEAKFAEKAKQIFNKSFKDRHSPKDAVTLEFFNKNRQRFSIISSNPSRLSFYTGIKFNAVKRFNNFAAPTDPMYTIMFDLYLTSIADTLEAIKQAKKA